MKKNTTPVTAAEAKAGLARAVRKGTAAEDGKLGKGGYEAATTRSVVHVSPVTGSLVGKLCIVRGNVAGVHAGRVVAVDPVASAVVLADAYRLWRTYTRDRTGSVSDIAANGLKEPLSQHSIGARLRSVTIFNPRGLELAEMTDAAYASLEKAAPK